MKKIGITIAGILFISVLLTSCGSTKDGNCGGCPTWGKKTTDSHLIKNG